MTDLQRPNGVERAVEYVADNLSSIETARMLEKATKPLKYSLNVNPANLSYMRIIYIMLN